MFKKSSIWRWKNHSPLSLQPVQRNISIFLPRVSTKRIPCTTRTNRLSIRVFIGSSTALQRTFVFYFFYKVFSKYQNKRIFFSELISWTTKFQLLKKKSTHSLSEKNNSKIMPSMIRRYNGLRCITWKYEKKSTMKRS